MSRLSLAESWTLASPGSDYLMRNTKYIRFRKIFKELDRIYGDIFTNIFEIIRMKVRENIEKIR